MAGLVEIFPRHPLGLNDAAVSNAAVDVKADSDGGFIVGGNAYNPDASDVAYLQFFAVEAGDVVLGTTVPVFTIAVPAGESIVFDPPRPIQCVAGLSYACTATQLGAGAPSSDCTMWLSYV
jgi:hypothetical protein